MMPLFVDLWEASGSFSAFDISLNRWMDTAVFLREKCLILKTAPAPLQTKAPADLALLADFRPLGSDLLPFVARIC